MVRPDGCRRRHDGLDGRARFRGAGRSLILGAMRGPVLIVFCPAVSVPRCGFGQQRGGRPGARPGASPGGHRTLTNTVEPVRFHSGTLSFAITRTRRPLRRELHLAVCAVLALFNAVFALFADGLASGVPRVSPSGSAWPGFTLGMKLVVSWVPERAGTALAPVVGMLTLGTTCRTACVLPAPAGPGRLDPYWSPAPQRWRRQSSFSKLGDGPSSAGTMRRLSPPQAGLPCCFSARKFRGFGPRVFRTPMGALRLLDSGAHPESVLARSPGPAAGALPTWSAPRPPPGSARAVFAGGWANASRRRQGRRRGWRSPALCCAVTLAGRASAWAKWLLSWPGALRRRGFAREPRPLRCLRAESSATPARLQFDRLRHHHAVIQLAPTGSAGGSLDILTAADAGITPRAVGAFGPFGHSMT